MVDVEKLRDILVGEADTRLLHLCEEMIAELEQLRAKLGKLEALANNWWNEGDEVDALYAEKVREALK